MRSDSFRRRTLTWLVTFALCVGSATLIVVSRSSTSEDEIESAQGPEDMCQRRLEQSDGQESLKYSWVVVDVGAGFELDQEATERWAQFADDVGEALPRTEADYHAETIMVSTMAWTPLEGGLRASRTELPVVMDRRWLEGARSSDADVVLAATYEFLDRNIAEHVLDRELTADGRPVFYSVCGEERVGKAVQTALGTSRAGLADTLVTASNAALREEDAAVRANAERTRLEQAHAEWESTDPDARSIFDGQVPPEVEATLQPHNVQFDIPGSWLRSDATLCFRSELAWLNCTALDVLDDSGSLADLTLHVPLDATSVVVVLNDETGSFTSELQLVLGEIPAAQLRSGEDVEISVRGPFPTDAQRRANEPTHEFGVTVDAAAGGG